MDCILQGITRFLFLRLSAHAEPYTTIDYPGTTSTIAYKYDPGDGLVSGTYTDSLGHTHGYTYDTGHGTYSADQLSRRGEHDRLR